jgi:hypothetical protein
VHLELFLVYRRQNLWTETSACDLEDPFYPGFSQVQNCTGRIKRVGRRTPPPSFSPKFTNISKIQDLKPIMAESFDVPGLSRTLSGVGLPFRNFWIRH